MDAEAWREWTALMTGCPEPRNERCGCCAHTRLSRYDARGAWVGLGLGPGFTLVWKP